MDLIAAENLAVSLMARYGLFDKGWHFDFDRAKQRLGNCSFGNSKKQPKITLSRYMAAYATEYEVQQIMLHEIAHALLPPSAGHGKLWKEKSASIGYKGERLAHNPYVTATRGKVPQTAKQKAVAKRRLERVRAIERAKAEGITVNIGDTLMVRDNIPVIIFKKARTRWYAHDAKGNEWYIPFNLAPSLKVERKAA